MVWKPPSTKCLGTDIALNAVLECGVRDVHRKKNKEVKQQYRKTRVQLEYNGGERTDVTRTSWLQRLLTN